MKKSKLPPRRLEKALVRSLVDPNESEQRKRHVKRWIYGESKTNDRVSNVEEEAIREYSIWQFIGNLITGDD